MSRAAFRVSLFLLASATLGIPGCATTQFISLRVKPGNPLVERLRLMDPRGPQLSERTRRVLGGSDCENRDPGHQLQMARRILLRSPSDEALHAVAELSYLTGRETATHDPELAAELYLDAARSAWHYLAGAHQPVVKDPNAAEHRFTAEIYNSSAEALMRLLINGLPDVDGTLLTSLTERNIRLEVPHPSAWMEPHQLGRIEFVSDYEVRNLSHRHVSRGIGVPLMIQRQRPEDPSALEQYYAEGLRFPATAVLRFPTPAESRSGNPVRLQLYDPRDSDGMLIGETLVPIQTDLSTPLARFLTNPNLELLDTFAFLRPDQAQSLRGLYMVQPYDPDRIPVLMVHGLWSSPMTWMEMFNDLQSDPVLRDHYQFWFYMYPTGEPMAFALADLREELELLQELCDPGERNEKLDQMVLVGHSMGGLLSYLMTVDSGDVLWDSVSDVAPSDLQADAETTADIQRVFFFESDSSIDRIVTIASPFRGSRYANRFTRWLGRTIVSLPASTMRVTQLLTGIGAEGNWNRMLTPNTSLDSLARNSAILNLVSRTSTPDEVEHHNIVGVVRGRSPGRWTDGVVAWNSAHRDDVNSELTVPASHSQVHRHEDAIAEVRRVLRAHLEHARRGTRVIPVGHTVRSGAAR